MEALAGPPKAAEAEPRLLLEWPSEQRRATSWVGSLLVHGLVIGILMLVPRTVAPHRAPAVAQVTPLVAPPSVLTQRAPNRAKVGHEFSLENLVPRRPLFIPPGAPASTRTAERKQAVPEPPKMESSTTMAQAPLPGAGPLTAPPPPQIQTEEKPKLAFETPGGPPSPRQPRGLAPSAVQPPSSSINEAMRGAIRSSHGGTVVGDIDLQGPGGFGPGLNLPGAPGSNKSQLELLSDPMGVDFKPYLIRILAAVKRNWMLVIPESARLGRQGRVQIQFAIARDGSVPKLVIAMASGTDALDRAAVAGISASTPFPPLPGDFTGQQVRLQFTFLYNLK